MYTLARAHNAFSVCAGVVGRRVSRFGRNMAARPFPFLCAAFYLKFYDADRNVVKAAAAGGTDRVFRGFPPLFCGLALLRVDGAVGALV